MKRYLTLRLRNGLARDMLREFNSRRRDNRHSPINATAKNTE